MVGIFNTIADGTVLLDGEGNYLSTISGTNGKRLEVTSDIDSTIDEGSIRVKEQNTDLEGYIRNSSHNMGKYNDQWQPFALDSQNRLRIVSEVVAEPHELNGGSHVGILNDNQIPDSVARVSELLTASGTIVNKIPTDFYTTGEIDTISGTLASLVESTTVLATVQTGRTTTYTVQTSWSDISFDTTYYENENSILEHDISDRSRINIHADGTYFLSYRLVVNATTTTTTTYSRLLKNGNVQIPASESQVRTYQAEQHELTGSITIDLYEGDYIVLQTYRSSEGGVNLLGASFRAIKIDGVKGATGEKGETGSPGENGLVTISGSAYFDAYDETGGLTLTSSWQDVPFDAIRKNSGNFTLNTDTELIIPFSSTYHLTARITTSITSGTNSSECKMRIVKDTGSGYVEIPGTIAYTYNRQLGEGTTTANITLIDDFSADDKIKVQVAQDSGSDTIKLLADGSSLSIHIPGGKPGRDGIDGLDGPAGSGSTIIIKDENTNVSNTPHASLNFVGDGVSVSDAGSGVATITIQSQGISLQEEGSDITATPHNTLNFVGDLVTVSNEGSGVANIIVQNPIFGSQYFYSASEIETSTNSKSPVNILTLDLTAIQQGVYRIGWYYEWRRSSTSNDYKARIQINDVTTIMEHDQEPQDATSYHTNSGFYVTSLSSGNHFIDFDHYGEESGNISYTRRTRLEIWRIS